MTIRTKFVLLLCGGLLPLSVSLANAEEFAQGIVQIDEYTAAGPKHFLRDFAPRSSNGWINVVVEIPAGTIAKWKVANSKGILKRKFKKGVPKDTKYLGYPGNYGMVPRTLLPKAMGGEGDSLNVIVLGNAVPRESVVKAKVIGLLKLLDRGKQDDKIIAVAKASPFAHIDNLEQMNRKFPGVLTILKTWFENYKGRGKVKSSGYLGSEEANRLIDAACSSFRQRFPYDKGLLNL